MPIYRENARERDNITSRESHCTIPSSRDRSSETWLPLPARRGGRSWRSSSGPWPSSSSWRRSTPTVIIDQSINHLFYVYIYSPLPDFVGSSSTALAAADEIYCMCCAAKTECTFDPTCCTDGCCRMRPWRTNTPTARSSLIILLRPAGPCCCTPPVAGRRPTVAAACHRECIYGYIYEWNKKPAASGPEYMCLCCMLALFRTRAQKPEGGPEVLRGPLEFGTGLRASQRSCKLKEPEPDFFLQILGPFRGFFEFLIWT